MRFTDALGVNERACLNLYWVWQPYKFSPVAFLAAISFYGNLIDEVTC